MIKPVPVLCGESAWEYEQRTGMPMPCISNGGIKYKELIEPWVIKYLRNDGNFMYDEPLKEY